MSKTLIYADHAATTPLSEAALAAMQPYMKTEFGNPSTLYSLSRKPRKAVSDARESIAAAIGALPEEIYFTSGGTEADNWALTGTAFHGIGRKAHFITSAIEHHAVLNTCAFLERIGCEVSYLPVDRQGIVRPQCLEEKLRAHTALVSVMLANNEIGTVEPIAELSAVAHAHGALFHTDAVQAVGHIPIDVARLGVDMLSASAHKFNGPRGVGFLYVRKGTALEPLIHGGAQENRMRAGTENVAGIVGMAAALREHVETLEADARRLESLRGLLLARLREAPLDFVVNGGDAHIPGSLSLSFRGMSGEALLHRLDLMGIAVATGSACDSRETVLSHVVRAIGVEPEYAEGTIRVTLGSDNDEGQILQIASALGKICPARWK